MKECEETTGIIQFFRKLSTNKDEWLTWRSGRLTFEKETQRPFDRGLVGLHGHSGAFGEKGFETRVAHHLA